MNTSPLLRLLLAAGLTASLSVACGGSFVSSDAGEDGTGGGASDEGSGGTGTDGGPGGSDTGGTPGAGGTPGSGGTGAGGTGAGGAGTGGEPTGCCTADATCDPGDLQLESESCPIGGECYSSTVCCSTVWCMEEQAACDAIPTCQEGETEVPECPVGSTCVQRALCGTVITCAQGIAVCDLGPQPNRHYVAYSALECVGIDFACPAHTTGFSDVCGCGCEQPDTCPEFIDCQPGTQLDPLCESDECPYSTRAL